MNADTTLLLATVLREQPCVDASLQSTVESVPFAVKCIAQQVYYTLYLVSVVRALLNDEPSAYVYLVHRLQELEELHRDVRLGRAYLVSSPAQADTVIGADVEHTGRTAEAPADAPAGAERVHYSLPEIVRAVPPVLPASGLELRVTLVGSGTVGRGILQTLLDDHPRLLHPNRLTVITRQPEVLAAFTARGVLCVDRKHGRQAINQCDVLILALQGHQVQEFVKQHFATKLPGADLDPPARLQASCVVFSTVAGMPRAKLASLLHHPERLITYAEVPTPGCIEHVAKQHEQDLIESTDLLIQSMADHDSFLRPAVLEAEDIHVLQIAEAIVTQDLDAPKEGRGVTVNVPLEVARRRAVAAAMTAAKAQYAIPKLGDVLLKQVAPPKSFLSMTCEAIRAYASVLLSESRQRDRQGKRGPSVTGRSVTSTDADNGAVHRHHHGGRDKGSTAEGDGAFLCMAYAVLPADANQALVRATLLQRGAPGEPNQESDESTGPHPATVAGALMRRMPTIYSHVSAVEDDLTKRYTSILRDDNPRM